MKYSMLRSLFVAYTVFCYSHIYCKKSKRTTPENAYDSHPSAIMSEVSKILVSFILVLFGYFNDFSPEITLHDLISSYLLALTLGYVGRLARIFYFVYLPIVRLCFRGMGG